MRGPVPGWNRPPVETGGWKCGKSAFAAPSRTAGRHRRASSGLAPRRCGRGSFARVARSCVSGVSTVAALPRSRAWSLRRAGLVAAARWRRVEGRI